MAAYAILLNPGHNRVYFETAKKLALAEFSFVSQRLSATCTKASVRDIANIPYLVFHAENTLSSDDIHLLARLSFAYALFSVASEKPTVSLQPIILDNPTLVPQKISTIMKYSGKTNELFTRLMINVASAVSDFSLLESLQLLDPLAGKGTTLYEGLAWGYNVWGVELNKKYAAETCVFLRKFLETERLKHTVSTETLHADEKKALKTTYTIAKNKADQKEGRTHSFSIIAGDARLTPSYVRKKRFHIIVSDLPYGVQHGSSNDKGKSSASRNPKSLLSSCLKGWYDILLPGGVMVLAWNTFVLSKHELGETIRVSGFHLVSPEPESAFQHRVDQAINRDIIIAKKI
ncbi:MAG: hypothetical protein AB1Z19_04225 [Eubacteriales bacterium]